MNYLAHAYLSFNNANILAGNMISDFVKGKKQYNYPLPVLNGIKLHREIDAFTDNHQATKKLKAFFAPQYRLYASAFADVVYDYFLANDKNQFATTDALLNFCTNTYQMLDANIHQLPEPFLSMLPYMKQQNWLYNYQYDWGIQKSFNGVVKRSAYLTESEFAFNIFCTHKAAMQECYNDFFPFVKKFAENKVAQMFNY